MQLSREELLKAYRDMATIRQFEERVQKEGSVYRGLVSRRSLVTQ